jgi:SAM-dependent methyltransferase
MARLMRRFRDYDAFAWLYSRYWGGEFHRALVPVLESTLFSSVKPGAAILDLCCGDGRLTSVLKKRGYAVTGLDGSEQMLAYARERCPDAQFLLADAREFKLTRKFDAVISTFDSLNHVMTSAGLARVFQNVAQCLKHEGILIFDLNREEAYRSLWSRDFSIVDARAVSVARGSFLASKRLALCDITVLRLESGRWIRSDFQMRQRLHPRDAVLNALHRAGFLAEAHPAGDLGMNGNMGFGRDVFIARKLNRARPLPARNRSSKTTQSA